MTAQTTIDFSRTARDKGIQQATDHADAVHDKWSKQAFDQFKIFLTSQVEPFKMEDFRNEVSGVLPEPPSLRAFGGIAMRAAKAGLIKRIGYTQVTNIKAHRANCALWQKI